MKIEVALISFGKIFTLDVKPSETIMQIRKKIESQEGVPIYYQTTLIYGGKYLADDKTIADYGLIEESRLFLITKLVPTIIRDGKIHFGIDDPDIKFVDYIENTTIEPVLKNDEKH